MAMNRPLRDWPQQRVWLIGASSGIGAALARALLDRGARVALSARSEPALRALAATAPARALALPLDVTAPDQWRQAREQLWQAWGGVDLVCFLAGDYHPSRAWELADSGYAATVDTNLTGTFHGLAELVPALLQQGHGQLSLVASVAGYRGLPKATVYGATKAALINLAETLYFDLAPRGLGVSLINPGFVRTPLTEGNDFRMPALIEPEQAATAIIAGFERGRFEIHFPRRFTLAMKLMAALPLRLYFRLLHRSTGL